MRPTSVMLLDKKSLERGCDRTRGGDHAPDLSSVVGGGSVNGQGQTDGFQCGEERGWVSMKIGSQEHRDAFCAHFMQTYIEYDPKTLPWPELDAAALRRLQAV